MSYPTCRACGFMVETTREPCRFCGHDPAEPVAEPKYPTPAAPGPQPPRPVASHDGWLGHFVRYLGVSVLVAFLSWFVVGIFWTFAILSRTGYRKRDFLLGLVPIVNIYISVTAFWRYTAKSAYWRPRLDRPSAPMWASTRPFYVTAGYLVLPIYIWLSVNNWQAFMDRYRWTPADRTELVDVFRMQGYDGPTSRCIAERLEEAYPGGPPRTASQSMVYEVQEAVTICEQRGQRLLVEG
jgi:hypothetical protein